MFNQPVNTTNHIVDDITCSQGEDWHILILIVHYTNDQSKVPTN